MATEVAQIPAEETPAVAAAATTENAAAGEAEKPAAEPVAAVVAVVAENAAAANNAQDNNKEDAKDAAAADGADAKKDGEAAAAAAAAPAKSEAPAQKFNVHKTNFEKDIIYLYQFSRTPLLPSLSPYCLKVETWLRLVGLKYEVNFHIFTNLHLYLYLNIFKFCTLFPISISLAGFSSSLLFSPSIHMYVFLR